MKVYRAIILTSMRMLSWGGLRVIAIGATTVVSVVILFSFSSIGAASANLSRSYLSGEEIPNGSLVSLEAQRTDYVQLANTNNGARLTGVAVADNDSLLAVDPDKDKVQVATSGTVSVLVSTLGGPIKVGDEIGVSPFSGLGMKALLGSRVIGLAQTDFDDNTAGSVKQRVTDKNGKTTELTVGYVRADISISTSGQAGTPQLNTLQRITRDFTGRTVPTLRIVLSLIVAIVSLLILITLIYAAIYGSIVSIGRNPLAKYAVFRTLGTMLVMALVTAITSGVIIFFLLK